MGHWCYKNFRRGEFCVRARALKARKFGLASGDRSKAIEANRDASACRRPTGNMATQLDELACPTIGNAESIRGAASTCDGVCFWRANVAVA